MTGKLFVVSGPSGAGKTTLVEHVVQSMGAHYALERMKTYTTKAPALGNLQDTEYHYSAVPEFQDKIAQNFFLEWSLAYGNYYGLPRSVKERIGQGQSTIVILDRTGARTIAQEIPDAILIWIKISTMQALEQRLQARGRDTQEHIARRLVLAGQEIEQEQETPLYHYHIVNDDLGKAKYDLYTLVKGVLDAQKV